jgi:hypothetical protein
MRQLALRIAERSFASFEGLLGWIAVSCVSTAYQQKAAGVSSAYPRKSNSFSPDGKSCSSGGPPFPRASWDRRKIRCCV